MYCIIKVFYLEKDGDEIQFIKDGGLTVLGGLSVGMGVKNK